MANWPGIYNAGIASVETGSTTVTLTGAGPIEQALRPGDRFGSHVGRPIRISAVGPGTVTLAYPWPGPSQVDGAYEIALTPYDSGYRQALQTLIDRYGGGGVAALAEIEGALDEIPIFIGPGAMSTINKADLISGVRFDEQVDNLAERDAYDAEGAGFTVLVADIGDGRAAIYTRIGATAGVWSDPAFITGPAITLDVTEVEEVPYGAPPDVDLTPVAGGYNLAFQIPRGMLIEPGEVTTLAPDQPAAVDFVPVPGGFRLDIAIPRGPTGDINGVTPFWNTRLGADVDAAAARNGLVAQLRVSEVRDFTMGADLPAGYQNLSLYADGAATWSTRILRLEGADGDLLIQQQGSGDIDITGGGQLRRNGSRISDVRDAFNGWRSRAVTGRAFMGGGTSNPYVGANGVSGGTGAGRTFLSGTVSRGIRQDGYIRTFKINVSANSGSTGTFKLKVMRPNGVSFDVFAQSDVINLGSGTGLKTFQLPVPLGPFAVGDRLGIFISGSGAGSAWSIAANDGNSALFREGDSTGGETYTSLAIDLIMWGECSSPMFVVTGDSIIEGHNTASNFHSFMHTGPTGNRNAEPFYKALNDLPPLTDYQNAAQGGGTWATARSFVADFIAVLPHHSILVHAGVNDIGTGRTWAQTERDMYSLLAAVPAGTRLFVTEILPWTAGNDTQAALIRTFNANYAAWCALNGAFLIECHDAMAELRSSTGQLDNLATAYNLDGVHLTQAGVDEFGRLIAEGIKAQIV